MNAKLFELMIFECQKIINDNQRYLTELDSKIGDADHGTISTAGSNQYMSSLLK